MAKKILVLNLDKSTTISYCNPCRKYDYSFDHVEENQ